mmetsp:Transcript_16715/g.33998  ORF Transcript_16715/g.33998 Transcript_16715/m.33998 type:complete len:849 (+) Transcript_16715:50-2596(+)
MESTDSTATAAGTARETVSTSMTARNSSTTTAATTTAFNTSTPNHDGNDQPEKYHALVIDSGAIIKQTAFTHLHTAARHFYTVPAVLSEIRDARSRAHLEQFQLRLQSLGGGGDGKTSQQLETRTPSQRAVKAVSEFARKTGDYAQLSGVDLQVLALLYDLEWEGNGGDVGHVRREPKRVLGLRVQPLNKSGGTVATGGKTSGADGSSGDSVVSGATSTDGASSANVMLEGHSFFQGGADGIIDPSKVDLDYGDDDDDDGDEADEDANEEMDNSVMTGDNISTANNTATSASSSGPKSWAMMVNPTKASTAPLVDYTISKSSQPAPPEVKLAKEEPNITLLEDIIESDAPCGEVDGQFDDASEEDFDEAGDAMMNDDDDESDGEEDAMKIANADSCDEISDEQCDVFILEPHEAVYFKKLKEEKQRKQQDLLAAQFQRQSLNDDDDEAGLDSDFPSLAAAAAVPYEGSDDDEEEGETEEEKRQKALDHEEWLKEEEERKKRSLMPMVNGKVQTKQQHYDSFRKYKNVVSSGGSAAAVKKMAQPNPQDNDTPAIGEVKSLEDENPSISTDPNQAYKSRILGAGGASNSDAFASSAMTEDDDDGEGWVTCTRDIQTMKATGSLRLNASHDPNNSKGNYDNKPLGPPISKRAACATTDFAMQNVILQMNLELLSVDGVRIRRLKTWVTRCSGCFAIYGGNDDKKGRSGGRLFCDKCGSNSLSRIAASVDRNTGRLKLHMKKNYQYNTRGTKFTLPKPGKGNKYEGDLLLAEDQLMYGAWAQKVKKGKSKASGRSIFGSDLASDLGCHTDLTKRDDIKVGFGRKNPNSSKFGRERRGKKKKSTDKACGLRRY